MTQYHLTREDYLMHHGVKGQKWGLRQWQNEDGSLTPAGREHYGYGKERYNTKQAFKNAKSEYAKAKAYKRAAVKRARSGSFEQINDKELDSAFDRLDKAKSTYKQARSDYRKDKTARAAEQKAWKQQRRDYIKTKTVGERVATGLLLGPVGLYNYNSLMAVNSSGSKMVAFGKTAAVTYLTGPLVNMAYSSIIANKEKEKY